jgi:ribosomal protein S18 acetylase RimI-like enzyme
VTATDLPLALHPPDPALHVRPARLDDAAALQANLWPARPFDHVYYFLKRARGNATEGRGLGAVVEAPDGVPVGYAQVTLWPRCAEISDLIVAEAYRGQGRGTALIQYLARAAREMNADCVEIGVAFSNPRALALYRRLGFRDSRTLQLDLGDGTEDVLYLRIKLR